jgi:hypothetical protein
MILKSYKTPTDVFICGIDFTHKQETFGITDDYSTIDVQFSDSKKYLDTCGFVFVLTREEIIEIKDAIDEDDGQNWVLLKDYVGDIELYFEDENGIYPVGDIEGVRYISDNMPGDDWVDPVLKVNCINPGVFRGYESLLEELN